MDSIQQEKLEFFNDKKIDCVFNDQNEIRKLNSLQPESGISKGDLQLGLQMDLNRESKNILPSKPDNCFYCESPRFTSPADVQCNPNGHTEVGRPDTMKLADNMHLLMHMHSRLHNRLLTAVVNQRGGISPQQLISTDLSLPITPTTQTSENQPSCPPEKSTHKCPQCGKLLISKRNLKYHMKLHTGDMDYKCYICNKGFTHKNKLLIHIKLHTGQKDFVCTVCSKAFVQKCDLLRHTKLHTGQKDFICEVCSKGFIQRSDLLKHSKLHTGQKDFVCTVCSKAFIQKSDLLRHNKTHWPDRCQV